ncbi:hypothetical protein HYPDE_41158 [Hyphomicrobium denitrificans 1NES1]|uniref:HTH cro/C1-type domain-containing protein n=1 Tax=Hyphomicrobium denitrificans 1NES1 TaxID=670307 RepID=N0BID4_9HYPH|nr:hypothetical protein HYPDE_41158 [Hyphomicrobium denitrificans 1NES1]
MGDLRTKANMTAETVAEAAKMDVSDYVRSEAGERRFRTSELYLIAKTLGVELKDIVSTL